MNLKRDIPQLVCILRFFLTTLNTIKDLEIIKSIAKPMLHLGYKMYTNPQLAETETKVISAELVETLQNKLDYYDSKFEVRKQEDISIANSTFIQMYSEVKQVSEKSKKEAKIKRKINRNKDIERHKRKRSQKRQKKKQNDKLENQKYMH